MKKSFVCAAALVAALGWATPSSAADVIVFDPDGGGGAGALQVASWDFKEGNSRIHEETAIDPITLLPVLTGHVDFLFQANLGTLQNGGAVYTNGDFGQYFTAVAGF